MAEIVSVALIVVAIIHLLPLSGALGGEHLSRLYGLSFDEPNLQILMRHRAVLFGLLGVFLLYAAFEPALQCLALIAGFASVMSYFWLTWSIGGYNRQVGRVIAADLIALVALMIGSGAYFFGAA